MTAAKVQSIAEIPASLESISQIYYLDIFVAPWNARKTLDEAALLELAESIKAHGLQVPLLVRPLTPDYKILPHPKYEIVAGHRRFQAAKRLGVNQIACIVRELTEDQAREIGLVDNLQREHVPALEEADAYSELKQRLGTPAAIAARVGKDVSYVARRLQLISLAEMPRRALAERLITIDHALLLARLGGDEQDANLKWALDKNAGSKTSIEDVLTEAIKDHSSKTNRWAGYWEPQSVLDLKHHIEQEVGRKLCRAPWDLDDVKLVPDAGACSSCPSNTKANDTLFGDLSIAAATCENGGCFEAKKVAYVHLRFVGIAKDASAGLGAIRISWRETSTKPRWAKDGNGPSLTQTFKRGQWIEAKKGSCEHARHGVTVDWSDDAKRGYMGGDEKLRRPGQVLTVCIAEKCKAHRKEWEKPKSENTNAPRDTAAEKAKEEKKRLAALHETQFRVRVAGAAIEKITKLPEQLLRRFLIDQLPNGSARKLYDALCPGLEKTVRTAALDSIPFARAVAVLSIEERHLEVWEHWEATQFRKEFISDLKLLGYDASKAWDKAAEGKPAAPAKPAAKPAAKKSVLTAAAKKAGRK